MPTSVLTSLFGHKSWADAELCAVMATLPGEYADQIHTCIRTLNHIHVVDRIFRAHLSAETPPFSATNTTTTPSIDQLRADVAATDLWYQRYVSQLTGQELLDVVDFTFLDGDRGRMSREEILLHVITHGGYHRGNIGQVLKSLSIAPPRDLYTKFLHQSEPARRSAAG